jgi:hypothetical protein
LAVEFFGRGMWWGLDWVPLFDERVEVDHLNVRVKSFQDSLPAYAYRKGRNGCVDRAFRHCEV